MQLLPIGVPQVLVMGSHDTDWLPTGQSYRYRAMILGDSVEAVMLPESGHFEMIAPGTSSWPSVLGIFRETFAQIAER